MNKIKRLPGRYSSIGRTGSSRSGGMLILVLVILGVGMILLTSALSVTIATRNRFYIDAQRSQAKLTVTSAAKTVVDAITVTQEIRDAKIEAWAEAGETIYIRSAKTYNFDDTQGGNNNVAPAIGDMASANTSVKFSGTKDAEGNYTAIFMDFETKIDAGLNGGATENLRVVLKVKPPAPNKGFAGLLTVGMPGSQNTVNNAYIGGGGQGKATNVVFLHGNFITGTGGSNYFCDAVMTGVVSTSAGFLYKADAVFMGDNAGLDRDSLTGAGIQLSSANGRLLYLGKSGGSVFWDKNVAGNYVASNYNGLAGNGGIGAHGGVFYHNTNFDCSAASNSCFYWETPKVLVSSDSSTNSNYVDYAAIAPVSDLGDIDANGPISDGSSNTVNVSPADKLVAGTADDNTKANSVLAKYNTAAMWQSAEKLLMTTDDARAAYAGVYPSSTTAIPSSDLSATKTFPAGNYSVSGGNLTGKWTFNLGSGKITLVIKGNLTISTGQIRFIGGSDDNFGYIFLDDNVGINIENHWQTTGIISDNHDVTNPNWADSKTSATPPIPTSKAYIYVIGFSNNFIDCKTSSEAGRMQYLEGYYGLYGNSGYVELGQMNTYARFEVYEMFMTDSLGMIPYCPAPWENAGGETPLTTKYEVDYYEYS